MSDTASSSAPPAPSSSPSPGPAASAGSAPAGGTTPPGGAAGPISPPKATEAPQKFRLKVRGQEREAPIEEVLALAGRADAADQAFREARRLEKENAEKAKSWEAREARLKDRKSVAEALREYGHDFDDLAKDYVVERYGPNAGAPPPPPNKEVLALQEKLAAYEAKEAQRVQQERESAHESERTRAREEYQGRFLQALKMKNLVALNPDGSPANPELAWAYVRRMAEVQEEAEDNGYEVPTEALATLAAGKFTNESKSVYASLEGDTLLDMMGDEWVHRVTLAAVAKLERERAVTLKQPPAPAVTRTTEQPRNGAGQYARSELGWDRFMRVGGSSNG